MRLTFLTHAAFVMALSVPAMAQEPAAGAPLLTLANAVAEALRQNGRMLDENDAVERSALALRLARSTFRPRIVPNIQGSFGQSDVANQTYRLDVSQRFLPGTEVRAGLGATTAQIPAVPGSSIVDDLRFYNSDATLMLTQPLLRGFGTEVNRRPVTSAEVNSRAAARQRRITQQAIVIDVAASYYRVVAQEGVVEVARAALDRARRLREASEAKLEAGLVSQLDTFRAQQLVSQAELQLLDARAAVEDGRDQLVFLLGRTSHVPFRVDPQVPRDETVVDADEATAVALLSRPDLEGAQEGTTDATRALAFARNQLLPQVDFSLSLTRRVTAPDFASIFGANRYQFATFFTISMPVDRTPQAVEFQNTLIERDRRQRALDTIRQRIAMDVRRAVRDLDRVMRTLAAAEVAVSLGLREVEVAQLRYERGLSNNLDVVSAEASLLSAQSRRLAAEAELAVTRLALRATMGVLNPATDLPGTVSGASGSGRP